MCVPGSFSLSDFIPSDVLQECHLLILEKGDFLTLLSFLSPFTPRWFSIDQEPGVSARGAGERLSSGLRGWVEGPIFRGSWDIIEGSRAELSH